MYQQTYYVPKSTGTLTDALLAYGVAAILHQIYQNSPGQIPHAFVQVTIKDQDGYYVLQLPGNIQEEWFEDQEWLQQKIIPDDLVRAVWRESKPRDPTKAEKLVTAEKKTLPEDIPRIDYNAIWDGIRQVNNLIEAHRQQGQVNWQEIEELRDTLWAQQPDRDVALLIGDYRMQAEKIHNQIVEQWIATVKTGYLEANLQAILHMFASAQSDIDAITKAWAKKVKLDGVKTRLTASQVFNPSMGKGQNRAKADQLVMNNKDYFWLLEYLKAVGLFIATAPRAFSAEKMFKSYVLAPANIELNKHHEIFNQFKRTLGRSNLSPVKADVLTSLDYAHTYLKRYQAAKVEDAKVDFEPNPRNTVKGFYVASYVQLSRNSFTMINLSFLGLPPWLIHINNRDDVEAIQAVIEEHQRIIRPLKEKFQTDYGLIDTYRDFLTGHRIESFFQFCAEYGEYVINHLLNTLRIQQMRVQSLDEIFRRLTMSDETGTMSKNDLTVFASTAEQYPGFHRIAYAIRHSTVIPQRQNANYKAGQRAEKSLYDVRYGLGNNLRRKADSAHDFLEALTEFIHAYNAETEQIYEKTTEERKRDPQNYARLHYRKRININNLDDILVLIKEYTPRLVCNMLVAYGYATTGVKNQEDADEGDEKFSEDTSSTDAQGA